MAGELGTQLMKTGRRHRLRRQTRSAAWRGGGLHRAARRSPGSSRTANRIAHRWIFTDSVEQSDASGRWEIDLSPMLADTSFQQTLQDFGIRHRRRWPCR